MIHVATVHWYEDCWIDLQIAALKRYSSEPFRTYAFLNHLSEHCMESHASKFDYVSCEDIKRHEIKLNLLADIISFAAEDSDDLLVFLDGDAFPIDDYAAFAREHLPDRKLIAVRREENHGDQQPHPCFCVTTVGFWRGIKGSWSKGYRWENSEGRLVSDVGGNLLGMLRERNIDWMPLLRSNRRNLHPIFFGVYGGLVYHHGAGFRRPTSRVINAQIHQEAAGHPLSKILDGLPDWRLTGRLRDRFHPHKQLREKRIDEITRLSAEVFEQLQSDPEWCRSLL